MLGLSYRSALLTLTGLTFIAAPAWAATPTLKNVTLSTSGLAQFDWKAAVDGGNDSLSLPVRRDQVDDVLKSLVVLDSQGQINGITLPGQQSLEQLFKDLPFTQNDLNHPASLLQALKGQKVSIDGPAKIDGRLVTLHKRNKTNDEGTVLTIEYVLSVMTAEGLKQVTLEDLDAVSFQDAALNDQIERALAAIKDQSKQDIRTLSIALSGKGARDIGFSYVVEAPLWKSAYRIVLPHEDTTGGEALIQGWAVLENTTGGDWDDVNLTLISGNPVTFKQPLYDTYTVDRPTLPVQVFGKVIPRRDDGAYDMAMTDKEEMAFESMASDMMAAAPAPQMAKTLRAEARGGRAAMPVGEMARMANVATSDETASQMLFSFPNTVTLKSGHTMMVPFINTSLKAERLYLYQPDVESDHPLVSLSFTNSTKTGMPPGIVTLYSPETAGPTYIGDAEMPLIEAGEDRMLSFAVDGKTNIHQSTHSNTLTTQVALSQGVMRITQVAEMITDYTVKAPAKEARDIIIEQFKMQDNWILSSPKEGVTETKTHYRIPVSVKPAEQKTVQVVQQQERLQTLKIADISAHDLNYYISSWKGISADAKKIFSRLVEMRQMVDNFDSQMRNTEATKQRIIKDQERLRANLSSVPEKSDLAERYLDQMAAQEDQLQDIEKRLQELQERRSDAMRRLKDFINDIEI